MKTWLCLLLSALAFGAAAQSPSVLLFGRRPAPLLPAGIGYRWEYTNLVDGAVSSWADTIVGSTWVQSTGGSQPTKDSDGVTFASGKFLVASNLLRCETAADALDCYLAIIKIDTLTPSYLIAGGGSETWLGIALGGTQFYNQVGPFGSPGAGVWIDYIYAGFNGGIHRHYTNGVVADSDQPEYAGTVAFIGQGLGGFNFRGVLKDLIVWTNVVGFDSLTVSNIHRYATNRYSFGP